ncbi:hypothetical protein R75461_07390 [Paraburkholderia nemoris]|uniref:hypothetical protein n=1 Tax=Paraburkholderia nemoris TaxID=2793076 RepID=UPI00190B1206|nr:MULTISPECIES: hypothetical protein [Paraburkholderia]MBK3786231.1 hypothetical protein [Paraburkholderia aspalathi]CAE6849260.1 hypothetical protein R75461_07390 [Paraburkholderia nemoris]
MFSTKGLPMLAGALMLASGVAHAQPKTTAPHTQTVNAYLPSADLDLGAESPASGASARKSVVAQSAASQTAAALPGSAAAAPAPSEPRLSIEDVDRIARSSIARQLAGNPGGQPGALSLNSAPPVTTPVNAPAPAAIHPASSRPRSEPVRFVGAFSDLSGQSVLYEYRNASYPAHVGTRLLNGWTVTRVDGFVVTVEEGTGKGARTWTETISGGTPAQDTQQPAVIGLAGRGLPDLSGPLPPSMPLSAVGR